MWRGEVSVGGGGEVRLTLPVGAECMGEVRLMLPGILLELCNSVYTLHTGVRGYLAL